MAWPKSSFGAQEGRVLIDDQDIRQVQLDSLRRAIGVVPQDTPLFNDTIEHNIRYGDINAPEERVIAAAKRARIHDTIESLKDGKLDTQCWQMARWSGRMRAL